MAKFDEDLGRALRECRRSKKITQKEVADYCGVSKMSVSYWESGKRAMYAEQLKRYCRYLGERKRQYPCYMPSSPVKCC